MTADLRDDLQAALGGTYTLERELGGGGMSRVFVADEPALGRRVVVKVLPPEVAPELSAERFAREVRLAARLQHPNIVPVLGAGAVGGVPYYVMPFVDGDSLRARLRTGALTTGEAASILRDVAKALAHAHRHGVVHRDVKPENVLLADGTAVVTDFGVAKAVSAATTQATAEPAESAPEALTRLGTVVGTPAYMAPEQAAGDPDVDHRADLYAWGLVAYELLAGRHPFSAKRTPHAFAVAHLTEAPARLETVAPATPPALAALVMQCLAKDPSERPAGAAALLPAVESALTATGAPAQPGGQVGVRDRIPPNDSPAVGVLPFANLSSDPENEYLSDGITDEIIGTLGRVRGVRVAGRASCFALKGQALTPHAVGERLKVTAVVEGSVRRAGNRIRVQAALMSAADGFQLWTDRYDRELTDIFAVQEEIAEAIARALTPHLTTPGIGSGPPAAPAPAHPEAYRLYLQAAHALRTQLTPAAYTRVLALLDRARTLDPTLARAQAATAIAYSNLGVMGLAPPHDVMPLARIAGRAALALDPALAEARSLLAQVAYGYDWRWEEAATGFAQALAAGPDDVGTLARAALFHASASLEGSRHAVDAARLITHGCAVDPLSAWVRSIGGIVFRLLRRYDDALVLLRDAVELDPHHGMSVLFYSGHLRDVGALDDALPLMERAIELTSRVPMGLLNGVVLHAKRGEAARAEAFVEEMLQRATTSRTAPTYLALALGWVGRVDEAFDWLARSARERDFWIVTLGVDPLADPLRGDARFDALLRDVGVPGRDIG